jgi:tRNA(adenine34) deaminase
MNLANHEFFMKKALDEAIKAYDLDEVPIGAVVVHQNKIVGRGHNMTKSLKDPTAHAEMIAITAAAETLESDHLADCTLYVTVEPCSMCAGAMINSKIKKVVFGAFEKKYGACGSVVNLVENKKMNHQVEVLDGVMESDSLSLLKLFFEKKRN